MLIPFHTASLKKSKSQTRLEFLINFVCFLIVLMSIATLSNAASTLTNSSDANTINQTAQYFDEANSNKVKSNLSRYFLYER